MQANDVLVFLRRRDPTMDHARLHSWYRRKILEEPEKGADGNRVFAFADVLAASLVLAAMPFTGAPEELRGIARGIRGRLARNPHVDDGKALLIHYIAVGATDLIAEPVDIKEVAALTAECAEKGQTVVIVPLGKLIEEVRALFAEEES